MLKAQLSAKIGILDPKWRKIEDILTGDFFGALDYLPRQPFLREFVEGIAALNPEVDQPPCEDVDWKAVESQFWPMIEVENKWVEPDVVLISNKWVLVIEVKLYSGLGWDQALREYLAGKEIAEESGLPEDSVFYLLVAPHHIDIAATLTTPDGPIERELLARASQFLWYQAADLIKCWRDGDPAQSPIGPEEQRLLGDLQDALKLRGFITFSGFLDSSRHTAADDERLFCPDLFTGFLHGIESRRVPDAKETRFLSLFAGFLESSPRTAAAGEKLFCRDRFTGFLRGIESGRIPDAKETRFLSRFAGFLDSSPRTAAAGGSIFLGERFIGFSSADRDVTVPNGPFLPGTKFSGFLDGCPRCLAASTLSISDDVIQETRHGDD